MAEIESGTPSNSRISGASSSSKMYNSRPNTGDSPEYHDTLTLDADSSSVSRSFKDTTDWELWGWYMYDFGAAAYRCGVVVVFYPLLIVWLATRASLHQQGNDIAAFPSPDFSAAQCGGNVTADCAVCVLGDGYRYRGPEGSMAELPSVRVSLGGALELSPYSLLTVLLGVVLVFQLLAFVTLSPLIDHGTGKKSLLAVSTGVGVAAVMLSINLYKATLWWTAVLLFVVSDVAFGQAIVVYNSFLLPLTKGLPDLRHSLMVGTSNRDQELARLHIVGSVSLAGATFGNVGGFLAVLLAYGSVAYIPGLTDAFAFRASITIAGLWWALWTFPAVSWLRCYRGPPFPDTVFKWGLGWQNLWYLRTECGRLKYAFWIMAALFVFTNGSTSLFQATVLYGRETLCMSNRETVVMALVVSLSAVLGCPLFGWLQHWAGFDSTVVIANILTVMTITACYAVLGFVTAQDSVGLHHQWEAYAMAACYGFCSGALMSFSRTLFLDCVPQRQQGLMFSLYGLVHQAGTWVGSLAVSFFLQSSLDLRYSFLYAAVMLLSASILLLLTVDQAQGMIDAGHIINRDNSDDIPLSVISGDSPVVRDSSSSSTLVREPSMKEHYVIPVGFPIRP